MKIETLLSPQIVQPTGAKSEAQMSARERAIEMIAKQSAPQSEQLPVKNASQVSPEEMTAVRSPVRQTENIESQPAPVETAPVEQEAPLSPKYAELARRQRAQYIRDQQLRQREADLKAREDAFRAPKQPEFDPSKYIEKAKLLENPIGTLTEEGLTYDQLTESALNAPSPETLAMRQQIKALEEQINILKGETESTKKSFQDSQEQSYKQALNEIRYEAKNLIKSDPQFEAIRATGTVKQVMRLIEDTYQRDGRLLTVEDAARQVEDYLVDQSVKRAQLKKVQARLAPKQSPEQVQQTTAHQQQQPKTLTNAMTSSRPLTAKERAIAAFEGRLQK